MPRRVRVLNPAHTLTLVNPRRRKRRKNTTKTKNTRPKTGANMARKRRSNPRRRRAHNARRRQHATELLSTHNPRHYRRRRRNPQIKGLLTKSAIAAVGAGVTNAAMGFVPAQWRDGWTGVGVRLGVAYGVGYVAERFVSSEVAELIAVGGAAAAVGEAINMFMGRVGGPQVFVPGPAPTALPPGMVPVGAPQVAPAGQSVSDIVEVSGPFTEYGDQGFGDIVELG